MTTSFRGGGGALGAADPCAVAPTNVQSGEKRPEPGASIILPAAGQLLRVGKGRRGRDIQKSEEEEGTL